MKSKKISHEKFSETKSNGNDELASCEKSSLLVTVENIQHLQPSQIEEVQETLGHGKILGVWETPPEWLTPSMKNTFFFIDLKKRIQSFIPKTHSAHNNENYNFLIDQATLKLTKYLILLRMGLSGAGRKGQNRSLKVSTVGKIAYQGGAALFALGLINKKRSLDRQTGLPSDILLFDSLSEDDFAHLRPSVRLGARSECVRMHALWERGFWHDMPQLRIASKSEAMKGLPQHNEVPRKRQEFMPLPDEYVSEMGYKSLWIIKDLAPNILEVSTKVASRWWSLDPNINNIKEQRYSLARQVLSEHIWKDHYGSQFSSLPFKLALPDISHFLRRNKNYDTTEDGRLRWPPKSYRDLIGMLGTIQMAHYFVVALSMGARQSETLSLERNCVAYSTDGRPYAHGRTFKLVQMLDGEEREWLLPDIAVQAIEQQSKLISLAEKLEFIEIENPDVLNSEQVNKNLWGEISASQASDARKPLRDINRYLNRYAKNLGMSTQPGDQNITSHRFRKTLARLAGLALTQAPKILMDVFGHKSIDMTLYYILSEKNLRAEIQKVARELRVLRAKEVVELIVESQLQSESKPALGGYGGLAAVAIGNAVQVYRDRVHRSGEDWGETKVYELAELLTMQGTAWEQVRTGVFCTKFPGEAGPCNKSKGRPEPSKCESLCTYRLEESFLREDVDGAIQDSVMHYERAISEDVQLVAAHWEAQIRAHVVRFSDLKEKWMSNSTVKKILNDSKAAVAQ